MRVLSLFDGMSCGKISLERAGIKVDKYYASEIDKNAIKVSKANYPEIDQVGDIVNLANILSIFPETLGEIDLLIGGSPCQGFSFAGKQLNFDDPRSKLFFEFVKIKNILKPKYFLLENVKMKKESQDVITNIFGVEPIEINSNLVSAQNRGRLYWTNIPGVKEPENKYISFQDIIEEDGKHLKKYKLNRTKSRVKMWSNGEGRNSHQTCSNVTNAEKVNCLTTKQDRSSNTGLIEFEDFCRYLTQNELEMCQTVPKGYTDSVSYGLACKMLGNGWTVDVIAHIFSYMKEVSDGKMGN